MTVRVQSDPFDPGEEANAFARHASGAGAVVTFSGLVRGEDGRLSELTIEHYPGMTEKALSEHRNEAVRRFSLTDALVIHRYGLLHPGETIMMVATAARHRKDAFDAAQYLMDYLKSRAPFWKKERSGDGEEWVTAKDEDEAALRRW